VLVLVVSVSEAWFTVIFPDGERIASYHFGSDAMVGHGGWTYLNPEVYGWTVLLGGTFAAVALVLVAFGFGRRSWRAVAAAVALFIVLVLCWEGLGSVRWERRATLEETDVAS